MGKKLSVLLGLLILIQPKCICAKDEKYDKAIILPEIIVTASRAERDPSEVSSYVNIVTETQIRESNAKGCTDLLKNLEGIYMYDSSGVGTTGRVNMRGFWGSMSTHQLVLIDGVPQNKGNDKLLDWDLIPLENIERIEIVKGPNSALYGDNAMSGVINIITKEPSPAGGGIQVSGSYGSFKTQNYTISASGGLLEKHGYYLSASRKSTDGFRRYCDYENMHLNGKLDLYFGDTQYLRLSSGYHERKRGALPWAITEKQIEEDRKQARPGSENDKEDAYKMDASVAYHKDFDDSSEIEVTSYYRNEDSEAFYTSGSTADSTKEQLQKEETYGLNLRLNTNIKPFGIEKSLTAGVDSERNEFDYKEYAAPDRIRGKIYSDYAITRDKIGPYIQDEISLLNPLKLIVGLRYDWIGFDFTDHKQGGPDSKKKEMSKLTPKCGIVYTYKAFSHLYANYSQAFRSPTIGQMFSYGSYSNPDLNPEEATNHEIGIRHLVNDYLKLKFSLYWMELDNEIWYDPDAEQYKNYGETSHKGVETRAEFKFTDALSGFINYSYARAKNESGEYKGKYLSNIPLHKGGLGMTLNTGYGLKAKLDLTRSWSSYLDSENTGKLQGYTTLDIYLGYEYKWLSAYLSIDNIFDEKYNSYGYRISSGVNYFTPAPGRTFTLGLRIEF